MSTKITKLTDKEKQEITHYYNRLNQQENANIIAYLPYLMKVMGQYLSLNEEKEIVNTAQKQIIDGKIIDVDMIIEIVSQYWKDTNVSIENAIRDLDLYDTGFIKLDFFEKVLSEYGEPLNGKEFKDLLKFLFVGKDEISCDDAINKFLKPKKNKKKTTKKPSKKKFTTNNKSKK
jgi:Ca2+-binding EF-hand superfamily protein